MQRSNLKKFKIFNNDKTYLVKYTSHLFHSRKDQKQYRGVLLETVGQIERMFKHAFNNYDMGDYKNTRLVIKFMYKNEIYGLLIALEDVDTESVRDNTLKDVDVTITIITIDKLDTRHYNSYHMFHNENIFLTMLDFELRPSNFSKYSQLTHICGITEKKTNKFFIGNYSCIENKMMYYEKKMIAYYSAFHSIITRIYTKKLTEQLFDTGSFWTDIIIDNGQKIYLKLVINTIDIDNEYRKRVLIVLNFITEERYSSLVESDRLTDPYFHLNCPDLRRVERGLTNERVNNNTPRRGLRIVRKSNENKEIS